MSLILKGNTIGGNNVTNLEVKSHGANFFNVNSDELKLNTNIVGNGYAGFNGRFASPIIRVQPGTLYFGFFGGYNARWIDINGNTIGYDSGGAGNVALAKKTPPNCYYVEFSGPMAQMNDHMLILGDKDMPFTPYVESSINVNGIYELPTNSYVDYDNKKIVNADGSEISVETTGELNIYGQATYIYQDNHLLSSKYLGIIEYGIPLA